MSSRPIVAALIALALLGASAAVAAESPVVTSAPAAASGAPKVFQFALQNGMQVLVISDHRAAVVTQMLWFKVGAVDDPPGMSGLAHFFEHMMFRGTKTVPADQYFQTIAKNGGEANAFTAHDYTTFYEQIAKDRLEIAMDLEADRLVNLDLSDANVNTERDVVLEERRMRVDNDPEALVEEQMEAALHLSHPYGRPVLGWPDEVRHIDRVSARDFYEHHYAPNNAVLIVAGDVTPAQIRSLAQDAYGKVGSRELTPRAEFGSPPRLAETRMAVVRPDARVPMFERIYRVPSYAQAAPGQAEALETLAYTLGGDESAALYRSLVVQKRLATDASASYDGFARDAGKFSIRVLPRPGVSLETVERAADAVIADFVRAAPRPTDLARAKTQLIASTIYRRDSQFELASAYGVALMIGLTVDDVNAWPRRVRAVTGDGVRKAAALLQERESVNAYLLPGAGK